MKSTGIVRRIDDLGRVVIPKELRRTLNINECDPLEIFVEDESIILKKYNPGCTFCGEIKGVIEFKNKIVCKKCLKEMKGAK